MDVKDKITQLRKERNWTLKDLAKAAGISSTAVYNWYNDKNYSPSRDKIEDICDAFKITLSEFYADVDVDKLSAKEIKLLQLFKEVPEAKQDTIIQIVSSFVEGNK